jgi:hypothetical protein
MSDNRIAMPVWRLCWCIRWLRFPILAFSLVFEVVAFSCWKLSVSVRYSTD